MPFVDEPVTPARPGRAPYSNEVVARWTTESGARARAIVPVSTLSTHYQGGDVAMGRAELEEPANKMIDDLLWTSALKGGARNARQMNGAARAASPLRSVMAALRHQSPPLRAPRGLGGR
jgi:hypothetical protein